MRHLWIPSGINYLRFSDKVFDDRLVEIADRNLYLVFPGIVFHTVKEGYHAVGKGNTDHR